MNSNKMKAIVCLEYGSPNVLEIKEFDKPIPKDDEVLIKIYAASVNPLDWHFMRGTPRMMRLASGIFKPRNSKLGADISGRIEAVGNNVKQFKTGDDIFGDLSQNGLGTFAEFITVSENAPIEIKPSNISYEEAAAVPLAGITALQGVRKANIKQGQKVLINGVSGGVGTFTVQIAKSLGAVVTGVCSTKNLELVKSIGADDAVDYTKEDFTQRKNYYDIIIDNVGNRSISDYRHALKTGGNCVIIGFTSTSFLFQHGLIGSLSSITNTKKAGLMGTAKPNKEDLIYLKDLIESGKLKPVIDKTYNLTETAEAIKYLETGHAKGKVIIKIN